ncbi:hypothetical protein LXL04_029129 [Taraxacum kok-saghyz]
MLSSQPSARYVGSSFVGCASWSCASFASLVRLSLPFYTGFAPEAAAARTGCSSLSLWGLVLDGCGFDSNGLDPFLTLQILIPMIISCDRTWVNKARTWMNKAVDEQGWVPAGLIAGFKKVN